MSNITMLKDFYFSLAGFSLAVVGAYLFYRLVYQLYYEYKTITLGLMEIRGILWKLLELKLQHNWLYLAFFIFVLTTSILCLEFRELFLRKYSDFLTVFVLLVLFQLIEGRLKAKADEDAYKHFIRNSGLDCGSFMAYSFFNGYIKYVVPSNENQKSKGLIERMEDYEAKHVVHFPIKKLLILQPKSMNIPPLLNSELMEAVENLEEVKLNVGGVMGRSYQLSVYRLKRQKWYVNVQSASPLLTYYRESKQSQLLHKYKDDVSRSFRKHLEHLIQNDPKYCGLVEVIEYEDTNEKGELVDVGSILEKYIMESLNNQMKHDIRCT